MNVGTFFYQASFSIQYVRNEIIRFMTTVLNLIMTHRQCCWTFILNTFSNKKQVPFDALKFFKGKNPKPLKMICVDTVRFVSPGFCQTWPRGYKAFFLLNSAEHET